MNKHIKRLTTCAIFSAIICVVTTFVAVPAPAIGNINLGDIFILCSAWLLGPYGAVASGIGACLADLFSGFAIYAPATLIIKALMAIACYYTYVALSRVIKHSPISRFISAAIAEAIMVLGYFLYECFVYGGGAAVASVPFNLIQGSICATFGTIVCCLMMKNNTIKKFSLEFVTNK